MKADEEYKAEQKYDPYCRILKQIIYENLRSLWMPIQKISLELIPQNNNRPSDLLKEGGIELGVRFAVCIDGRGGGSSSCCRPTLVSASSIALRDPRPIFSDAVLEANIPTIGRTPSFPSVR